MYFFNVSHLTKIVQVSQKFIALSRILGDMLSVDGDADAAVEATIRIGWNKFRQLVPLLSAYQEGRIIDYKRKVVQ